MNLTMCRGRGFTLMGAGLRFQKLAWAKKAQVQGPAPGEEQSHASV